MNKLIIGFFILIFVVMAHGQSKKIIIVNKFSNEPLENVNINYVGTNEATFTNKDGVAAIDSKGRDIKVSIIGFDEINLTYEKSIITDSIFLSPSIILLDEVIVKSFKLKEAFNYVLNNYEKLYVNTPFEKECNFKETVLVNNELKRLILSKINWWDISYNRIKNKVKLRLETISFNKDKPLDIFADVPRLNTSSMNAYIEPITLLNIMYLNVLLKAILTTSTDVKSNVSKITDDLIDVNFEYTQHLSSTSSAQTIGVVTFDKKTKAVINISLETANKGNIDKNKLPDNNKEVIIERISAFTNISFSKTLNNKYSLKSLAAGDNVAVTYDNKTYNISTENNIYVLKEIAVKKVSNDGIINLSKAICKSFPVKSISNIASILLTDQEMKFVLENK